VRTQDATGVTLNWLPAMDAESSIYEYAIYRDGLQISEAFAASTSFHDGSVLPDETHDYRVAAINGAYRERALCALEVP